MNSAGIASAPLSSSVDRPANALDRFLFSACRPALVPWLRIGFAVLVLLNVLIWFRDGVYWFSDEGVLSRASAIEINKHQRWSLLFWLPSSPLIVNACLGLLIAHCLCLLLGIWSRFQMACIFVWLVSFQNRNPIICDAEDTLFRCFAFYMMFLPLDCGRSLVRSFRIRRGLPVVDATQAQTWAVSLMQFQMTVIYLSATWAKLWGSTWQDGTALYYVSQMTDLYGRLPLVTPMFDQLWLVKAITWSVVAIEALLPVLLWIPRTRMVGVVLGIALHLGIELTMNLFLFEWLMILGLISFAGRSSSR